jgi:hypothetical protein
MTDVRQSGSPPRRSASGPAHLSPDSRGATVWLGWLLFVGILLFAAGVINVLQGVVALVNPDFYLVSASGLVINVNYTVWGWALLILGATLIVAGFGIALGYGWARVVGVVVASINALVNLAFVSAYPLWTVIAVAFDVLVIYALVVHGDEGKALRSGQS